LHLPDAEYRFVSCPNGHPIPLISPFQPSIY
jgi:hypothetical protein